MDETVWTEDGVRLWAVRGGEGHSVVFCHGGPGLWDTLGEVAGLLAGVATVHRWDQRGCGRSQRCGPYSVARSLANLDAVRRHFGLERMALLGHSWGAQLALRYALDHPERVSGLVYVSGTGLDRDADWHGEYARNLRSRLGDHLRRWETLRERERTDAEDREFSVLQWSVDFADRDRALEHAQHMATPWLGVNFECNAALNAEDRHHRGTPQPRARCEALNVPVLIVDGAEDIRPRRAVDSLERALPLASRVTLNGAGHLPWIEDPDGFQSAVGDFLLGLREPTSSSTRRTASKSTRRSEDDRPAIRGRPGSLAGAAPSPTNAVETAGVAGTQAKADAFGHVPRMCPPCRDAPETASSEPRPPVRQG